MTPIVLVLAGGASNRFWPLTDKPLLDFGEANLLARHLRSLQSAGAQRFVIVGRTATEERIRTLTSSLGLRETKVAVQAEARGMADAVLAAREAIASFGDSAVYITQAQDVVDASLHRRILLASGEFPEA